MRALFCLITTLLVLLPYVYSQEVEEPYTFPYSPNQGARAHSSTTTSSIKYSLDSTYNILKSGNLSSESFYDKNLALVKVGEINGVLDKTSRQWVVPPILGEIDVFADNLFQIKISDNNKYFIDTKLNFKLKLLDYIDQSPSCLILNMDHNPIVYNFDTKEYVNFPYQSIRFANDSIFLVTRRNYNLSNIHDNREIEESENQNISDRYGQLKLTNWWPEISYNNGNFKGIKYLQQGTINEIIMLYNIDIIKDKFTLDKNSQIRAKSILIDSVTGKESFLYYGEPVSSFQYDSIFISSERSYPIGLNNGKYSPILRSGMGFKYKFDSLHLVNSYYQTFKDGKCGLQDLIYGEFIVPCEHKLVLPIEGDISKHRYGEKYLVYDGNYITIYKYDHKVVNKCKCKNPYVNNQWNANGKTRLNQVFCFDGKNTKIYSGGGQLIDITSIEIFNFNGDQVFLHKIDSTEIIDINDQYGLINKNLEVLIPFQYSRIYRTKYPTKFILEEMTFKNKRVIIYDLNRGIEKIFLDFELKGQDSDSYGRYFKLSDQNKKEFKIDIDKKKYFVNVDRIVFELPDLKLNVKYDGEYYGLVDYDQKIIFDFLYLECQAIDHQRGLFILKNLAGKCGISSYKKEILIPFVMDSIFRHNDKIFCFHNENIEIYKYENTSSKPKLVLEKTLKGYRIVKKQYDYLYTLKDNKYGYINGHNSNKVLEPQFDAIIEDIFDFVYLVKDKKYYTMNQVANGINESKYDSLYLIPNKIQKGRHGPLLIGKINNLFTIIPYKHEMNSHSELFDNIIEANDQFVIIKKNEKYGLYDIEKGKLVIDPDCDSVVIDSEMKIYAFRSEMMEVLKL